MMRFVALSIGVGCACLALTPAAVAAPTVLDLVPGATGSFGGTVTTLESSGPKTYFYGGIGGNRLYVTDGTLAGTSSLEPLTYTSSLTLLGQISKGPLYAIDGELFVYDGARTRLTSFPAGSIPRLVGETGSKLAFLVTAVSFKHNVWVTDGTAANTKDLGTRDSSSTNPPAILGDRAFLITNSGAVESTDGVSFSPALGGWAGAGTPPASVACVGKLFIATSNGVAVTDGVATPTALVTSHTKPATRFVCGGSKVFFLGTTDAAGTEPWVSDGTVAGTRLLRDVMPGTASTTTAFDVVGDGRVYFFADDGTHGREPWTSDGTEAGTVLVSDLSPGAASTSFPFLTNTTINGRAFFVFGSRFYVADGAKLTDRTAEFGAVPIPSGTSSDTGRVGDRMFYSATTPATGRELVVLDPATFVSDAGPPDGGDADATDAVDATETVDSATSDSATTDTAVSDAAEIPDSSVATPVAEDDSGCSCSTPRTTSGTTTLLGLIPALALVLLRRRR